MSTELFNPPIVTTRLFDAPREKVFAAFSDQNTVAQWWGPSGFTNTFSEFDFQTGGVWHFNMHAPDGSNYEITQQVLEVDAPKRIVLRNPQPGHEFQITMIFNEVGKQTRLTWSMQFESAEEAARVRPFVTPANEQNFDKLEAQLKSI